ncbi:MULTISPECIES: dihydrofolate reductase family protein [Rhodococcus]|uniref:Deaminase n=1 Tax=Rhodococcus qingshengii TaxID=334542 RepID=A0A2A5J874_RHOSG|nr:MULTISPECIES: dihydrofolate reductase family protein [Rhodococcus]MDN5545194.1 dihydrofolate reductase family protein [Rhodococcus sp. (in: high G+C Gram-positive bacteria)]MCJ0895945.1 dihydrofolate reductase family protein [Rhodococcus sp. ARC_M13]MCZ4568560.1 dihydrofolate reductase family protein [Rhodococcus erythropolis]MDV8012750.1 dihydrofolate reductase family protein [Rhodococcus sp. IEGM 1241]PCK25437.1 deaminase [Rhodococcus qingshengii]
MRKLVYYVGASLDGYIAGPDGEFDFFPVSEQITAWICDRYPETVPTHVRPALGIEDAPNRTFDTVVMGRGSYEPGLSLGVTSPFAHLRQFVVSSTLPDAEDPAVTIVRTDPRAVVRSLKEEEGQDIWLCGGGTLAGELLPEIDELIVKRYPVVAGAGIPMIRGNYAPTLFTPTATESLDDGASITWLKRNT